MQQKANFYGRGLQIIKKLAFVGVAHRLGRLHLNKNLSSD